MSENHWTGEAQLMGYGESDSSGAWIKFQVTPEDLEHFRGLKGTTFDLSLENPDQPVGPQEKKPERVKGGNLSKQAGKMCNVAEFRVFAQEQLANAGAPDVAPNHPDTVSFVRAYCEVGSRAELDHNETAASKFMGLMAQYAQWCSRCQED